MGTGKSLRQTIIQYKKNEKVLDFVGSIHECRLEIDKYRDWVNESFAVILKTGI